MPAHISISDLSYSYPNRQLAVLRDINMEILPGEFLLVTGPSASGKSTLLRTLNGLVPHFSGGEISGSVTVQGLDVLRTGPRLLSQLVGFVAQNPEAHSLFDRVEQEIAFALENANVARPEMVERVDEVLRWLELSHLRNRSLSSLSGGERQRVAIACALALRPHILVLDEPLSQLDPDSADNVMQKLLRLNQELGLSVILAEHRLDRVLPIAHRMAYLEEGKLIALGRVREVLHFLRHPPPLIELAYRLHWEPVPLSLAESHHHVPNEEKSSARRNPVETSGTKSEADQRAPLLQTKAISYAYVRGLRVLDKIDLSLREGSILAVMGANGSGKSTLLKCLIGLIKPAEGSITLRGQSTLDRTTVELSKEIAYLPQYPDDLLFADTVSDELHITLSNHKLPADDNIPNLLSDLHLLHEANAYPRDLSTGQRQRVALGAVMVTQPDVLLLDEPTRGLDGHLKQELAALWCAWRDRGMGIILATHDVELAAHIADEVLILEEGRQIASGPIKQILDSGSAFAPQIAHLFPGKGWLTVDEAVIGLVDKRIQQASC